MSHAEAFPIHIPRPISPHGEPATASPLATERIALEHPFRHRLGAQLVGSPRREGYTGGADSRLSLHGDLIDWRLGNEYG